MHVKLIATGVGAFGLGALLGWAVTTDIWQKRYDDVITEKTKHIWALQDFIDRAAMTRAQVWEAENTPEYAEEIDPNQGTILDITGESAEPMAEPFVGMDTFEDDVIPEGETPEETRTNLQRLIDQYTVNPEDSSEEIAEYVDVAIDDANAPPFVISRETYAYDEEGEDYSKITLQYYPRDRVLLDDDEDPIDDIPRMVGWRNLSQFGGESGDPDVVFVRNRRLQTDFEVVKEDDARLPLHVQYGMEKEEFRVNKAAGLIKLRREDE